MHVCSTHSNVPLRRDPNVGGTQKCTKTDKTTGSRCTNPVVCSGDRACEPCSNNTPCCIICGEENVKR